MPIDYRDLAPDHARFRFCPMCRGQLEDRTDEVNERIRPTCIGCGWTYYPANPSGGLVVAETDESIVFIYPPDTEGAALPGGIAEYGETPEECVVRETKEETGLDIAGVEETTRSLLPGVFGPMLHFGFRARIIGGELREGDEGVAVLHPKDQLPPVSADRDGSRRVVAAYLASARTIGHRP